MLPVSHSGITCTMGAIAPEPTWWSCQGHPWDQASATNRPEEGQWQWWIRNNRNTRSKWIRSCHFDGWFMFYTNLYRSLQLFTDLNSMWFTRKSGFPQPHQVPAAFACPRALPGNIPVIKDSLDCEEIVSLSVYGKVTYMIQIYPDTACTPDVKVREFHARIQVSPTS